MSAVEVEFNVEVDDVSVASFVVNWPSGHRLPRVGEFVEFDSEGAEVPPFTVNRVVHFVGDSKILFFAYVSMDRPLTTAAVTSLDVNPMVTKVDVVPGVLS